MRKLILLSGLLPCLLLVAGCPKKGDDAADAAAEAAAVDTTVDAAPATAAIVAKNASAVARFGNETKLDNVATTIAANSAVAHTSPKTGTAVQTLKLGTAVTEIAQQGDWYLVAFADPTDTTGATMLEGWVSKDAFTATVVIVDAGPRDASADASHDAGTVVVDAGVDAGKPATTCAAGQVLINTGKTQACKKTCTADSQCKTPPCAVAATVKGGTAKVCASDP